MTRSEAAYWLAAAVDGEGCVRNESNEVGIANTDADFIEFAAKCLELLGVDDYRVHVRMGSRKPLYNLSVYGVENCKLLSDALPLVIKRKRNRLLECSRDKRFDKCDPGCKCGRHLYYPPKGKQLRAVLEGV